MKEKQSFPSIPKKLKLNKSHNYNQTQSRYSIPIELIRKAMNEDYHSKISDFKLNTENQQNSTMDYKVFHNGPLTI